MNLTKKNTITMEPSKHENYLKFFIMIGTSMLAMFFLMYLHSYELINHAWFSETRLFMTMIMGGAMIIIMLAFMLNMYKNKKSQYCHFYKWLFINHIIHLASSKPKYSYGHRLYGRHDSSSFDCHFD